MAGESVAGESVAEESVWKPPPSPSSHDNHWSACIIFSTSLPAPPSLVLSPLYDCVQYFSLYFLPSVIFFIPSTLVEFSHHLYLLILPSHVTPPYPRLQSYLVYLIISLRLLPISLLSLSQVSFSFLYVLYSPHSFYFPHA